MMFAILLDPQFEHFLGFRFRFILAIKNRALSDSLTGRSDRATQVENSIVVPLLTDRKRNGQAISGWRQRASSIGCVCAGRVLEAVEVEDELAGLRETSVGEARV